MYDFAEFFSGAGRVSTALRQAGPNRYDEKKTSMNLLAGRLASKGHRWTRTTAMNLIS